MTEVERLKMQRDEWMEQALLREAHVSFLHDNLNHALTRARRYLEQGDSEWAEMAAERVEHLEAGIGAAISRLKKAEAMLWETDHSPERVEAYKHLQVALQHLGNASDTDGGLDGTKNDNKRIERLEAFVRNVTAELAKVRRNLSQSGVSEIPYALDRLDDTVKYGRRILEEK